MSAAVIGGAATGVAQIVGSAIGSQQRKDRQRVAQQQFNQDISALRNQDIVDPYKNIENLQEEGVVDTQAAEFQLQGQQQNLANVLGNFQQGGGAGIAGSAQALANAATQASQGATASISQQVQQNQQARRAGAQQAQQARAQGQLNRDVDALRNQAIVDPYKDIENLQEEGVVDTQAAQFQLQGQQQNLANVLGNFQQGGGAGIAGSAQALANAATQASQGATASISQQVQQNQQARRAGAQAAQQARAQGQQYVQDLQENRNRTLVNLSQGELDAATAARQASHRDLIGGVGRIGGAIAGGL